LILNDFSIFFLRNSGVLLEIAVIGTGYVGLVAGTCLSDLGNNVVCVDNNSEKIEALENGKIPIFEPGLEAMVQRNVKEKRLFFTTDIAKAVKDAEVIFIAVGTPPGEDGSADLQHVLAVAESIGKNLNSFKVIVDKSTVPVGTAEKVREKISEFTKEDFDVVSNPEFLREGSAIKDFLEPDRVVIGYSNEKSRELMNSLYSPLGTEILFTDVKSAELIKYASNAFLATKISFINEIANFCEKVGADVQAVSHGMGLDSRIGPKFLNAGAGYGGSCFPKDVKALIQMGKEQEYNFEIVDAVERVNESQKKKLALIVEKELGNLNAKKIALLGLAFKPNTDDMREATSIVTANMLSEKGAKIKAFDPVAMEEAKKHLPEVELVSSAKEALKGADAMVLCTEWNEFKEMDLEEIRGEMAEPLIIDGRNIFEPKKLKDLGFRYISIGRK
jgi:UDPglucose 6-dehydrogenase